MPDFLVRWVVEQPEFSPEEAPLDYLRSERASRRLRIALPARSLAAAGVRQNLGFFAGGPSPSRTEVPAVAVFSKLIEQDGEGRLEQAAVSAALALRGQGSRIVLDVCDNLAVHPGLGPMRALLEHADRIVVATPALADVVQDTARRPLSRSPEVIADPVEGRRESPVFVPPRAGGFLRNLIGRQQDGSLPLRLLWFGGPARNFAPVQALLPQLSGWARQRSGRPVDLNIVTAPWPAVLREIEVHGQAADAARGLRLRFTPWSRETLAAALAGCDLVLLPGDPNDPLRLGASANRLVESFWAGRFVIANGLPSYMEFRNEAWIGEDLISGLDWALSHRVEVLRRIARAQERIAAAHLAERVGARWVALLRELAAV